MDIELIDDTFPVHESWKKYEPEIMDRIAAWKANGSKQSFFKFIKALAVEIHDRGDGLVFVCQRPESKKFVIRPHFVKWVQWMTGWEGDKKVKNQ